MDQDSLKDIRVLTVDDERLIRDLVRDVLMSLGFRDITQLNSGRQAIDAVSTFSFDFIITDWRMKDLDGIDLIRYVRRSPQCRCPHVPIILLTGNTEAHYVLEARDAGVNEYMIKPFSAEQLVRRIRSIIEKPRSFVVTPTYSGPDRRRSNQPPPQAEIAARENLNRPEDDMAEQNDDSVKVYEPDHSLHNRIGKGTLDQVLSKEAVAHAEQAIQQSSDKFAEECKQRLEALEASYAALQQSPEMDAVLLAPVIDAAFSIKIAAAQSGYDLASAIAKSLHLHCENLGFAELSPKNMDVIAWHISSIRHLLNNKIKGTGGSIGAAIMGEIQKLG